MLRHFDRKRLGASLCLATLGILGISSNVQAQRASAPFKHPSSALTTIQRIVNLPGLGPRLLNLRVLPASACYLDTKKEGGISLDAASDPTLYCSFYDYSGDTFIDPVWNFPTVGFAATTDPRGLFVIPTTIQTGATAPNNVAYIALGEMGLSDGGKKPQIRSINFVGGLYDVSDANFATPKKGAVIIILFDGVDQNTAPSATNIAKTLSGADGYVVTSPAGLPFGNYGVDVDTDPIVINNAQGKFGFLAAKGDDPSDADPTHPSSPATVELFTAIGAPSGPNATYVMTDHDFTKMTLSFFAADALFNQSTNNQPFNLMTCLRGNNADHTASTRGTVQGNIRRRGVSPPKLPIPAVQNPEAAPGRYIMAFFTAGTQSLIRTDYFYTQPSYNADGSLTTNYIISGVPAGTYDVVVAQQPISDGTKLDTLWDISTYPFADFVPSTIPNVVVTSGGITTLNARLEHLADIASEDGTFNPDGVVGLDDLGRLSLAFDTKLGDDLYDPGADLVGTVDPILNPMGLPDNAVNLDDLGALSFFFDVLTTREP